jgi:glycosyltransferase involved in cell wall biosynthesis
MSAAGEPILVVANWRDLTHPQAGGAERVCEEMAARLAADGHRVVLLSSKVAGRPATETVNGYTIRRAGGRFTVYPAALLWLLRNRRRVATILDSQNGIPFFTPLVARRRAVILLMIWHVHQDQFAAYFPRPVAAVGRWLETAGSRAVYGKRMIIAISPSTRQGVRRDLKLAGDIRVIPPGWSLSVPPTSQRRPRTTAPTIVSVGRLVPHKRTHLTIQAMAELRHAHPDLTLHIVGSGPELAKLQADVDRLQLSQRVHFHPDCTDAERDALFTSAWLSINASAGEGWGISVIEANALGIPVLAFARPGLRDSIRNEITGWLVEEGSSLSDAASDVLAELADNAIAERFSQEAMGWAANFTWQSMAQRLFTALAIERARLGLSHADRRRPTDLGAIIHVPIEAIPASWQPALRIGDGHVLAEDGLTIFLAGTDTSGARTAMSRLGLPAAGFENRLVVRVARGADYLLPFTGERP